jgi:hypothetical protein
VTTRLSSCARLEVSRLVATLALCGAAVLMLPSPCAAAVPGEPLDAAMTAASGEAPARNDAMGASARFTDPNPSDDEDDDDDDDAAPDAPATASDAAFAITIHGEGAVLLRDCLHTPIAPLDGQNLRGPPHALDDTDIDDDDDDDLDTTRSLLSAPHRLAQSPLHLHSAPARRHSPDGPSLRAP